MSLIAKARELKEKAINVAMNYTEPERKVREATNPDEPWGPHGQTMSEIAAMTYRYEEFPEVMGMLWKRMLTEKKGPQWRRIYKSLLLLDHLLANGSERVVEAARDRLYDIRRLSDFQYTDPKTMKDHGINVSEKSKKICALISDDEELREVRAKAKANKDKYIGVANPALGGMGPLSPERTAEQRGFDDEWNSQVTSKSGRRTYRDDPADDEDDYNDRGGGDYRAGGAVEDDDDFSPRGTTATNSMQSSQNVDLLGMSSAPAADAGFAAFAPAAAAPAPTSDFGAFNAAPQQQAAPSADFGAFNVPSQPVAAANFGGFSGAPVPQQQQAGGFGDFNSFQAAPAPMQQQAPPQQQGGGGFDMFSSSAPSAAPSGGGGGADLLGGFSGGGGSSGGNMGMGMGGGMVGGMGGGMPSSSAPSMSAPKQTKPKAPAPAKNNTWSGLDISLDNLSLTDSKKGKTQSRAPTSVFGDKLEDHAPAPHVQHGGPMGGGMGGMGMGMQQPMGGMGMGMQQPMGGMGMGMQQPMGGMGGMGMQQQPGMMGQPGMMQPGMMGQQGMGMGMQQPGMMGQQGMMGGQQGMHQWK